MQMDVLFNGLRVLTGATGTPVIRPMKNVTTVAGEELVLRCYVSGYPIHSITWRKGQLSSHDFISIAVVCDVVLFSRVICICIRTFKGFHLLVQFSIENDKLLQSFSSSDKRISLSYMLKIRSLTRI